METKTKLVWLELIGGLFGWAWIIASVAALYFAVVAIFFGGRWAGFFWAMGIGLVTKWLARGFRDSQLRVAYVAEQVILGRSPVEAEKEWVSRYMGGDKT